MAEERAETRRVGGKMWYPFWNWNNMCRCCEVDWLFWAGKYRGDLEDARNGRIEKNKRIFKPSIFENLTNHYIARFCWIFRAFVCIFEGFGVVGIGIGEIQKINGYSNRAEHHTKHAKPRIAQLLRFSSKIWGGGREGGGEGGLTPTDINILSW